MKIRHGKYTYRGYTITCHGYHQPDHCVWWEAVDKNGEASFHGKTLRETTRLIDESFFADEIKSLKTRIAKLEKWLVNNCEDAVRLFSCDECGTKNCPMKDRKWVHNENA